MKILSVDPGEKRIGLAVSDPTGLVARALTTLKHASRSADAAAIAATALAESAEMILVGMPLDSEGLPGPQARKSERLAEAIREQIGLPVVLWDESYTTADAHQALRESGRSRRSSRERIDALAAARLLQGYLDAHAASDA